MTTRKLARRFQCRGINIRLAHPGAAVPATTPRRSMPHRTSSTRSTKCCNCCAKTCATRTWKWSRTPRWPSRSDLRPCARQYAQALVDGGNPAAALTLYESVVADGDAPAPGPDRRPRRCWSLLQGAVSCLHRPGAPPRIPPQRSGCLPRRVCRAPGQYLPRDQRRRVARQGRTRGHLAAARHPALHGDRPGRPRGARDRTPCHMWNAVTAAEACVALGKHDEAIDRAQAFLRGPERIFRRELPPAAPGGLAARYLPLSRRPAATRPPLSTAELIRAARSPW